MSKYSGIAGKRILVTGATSGLGFAMAKALVNAGAKVAVSGRNEQKINTAVASFRGSPGECKGILIDVRDEQSICLGVAEAAGAWGGIDILVNNAGIGMRTVNPAFITDPQPFWKFSAAGFRDLVDTNFTGYFLVAKAVVPYFLEEGAGRIINIGVSDHTMQAKGFIPYGPSRAATDSMSHIMAKDLAGYNVAVNLLMPGGGTTTGMIPDEVLQNQETIEARAGFKFLSPDIMSEPTLFLCSDEANGVIDQRISAKDFENWREDWLTRTLVD